MVIWRVELANALQKKYDTLSKELCGILVKTLVLIFLGNSNVHSIDFCAFFPVFEHFALCIFVRKFSCA